MRHKYCEIIKLSMKSILNNKSSVVILLFQALVPIIVMGYLWSSIFQYGQVDSDLNKNQLIIYYIGVNFINFFILYAIDWDLNSAIHSGELSNIIHRPISIQSYYFCRMIGDRLANLFLLMPILIVGFIYLFINKIINISIIDIFKFLITVILAAILWFLFSYSIGCLAYWFENLFFVLLVKEVIVQLLSGYYFPISMLPSFWQKLFKCLPFQYFGSFPAYSLISKTTTLNWVKNLFIELIWIGVFYLLLLIVNNKGLKQYSDVRG